MSDNKLVLHPLDPLAEVPSDDVLRDHLSQIGFLGSPGPYYGRIHYKPGAEFSEFIAFERSHKAVILEPTPRGLRAPQIVDSRTLCSVELEPLKHDVEFLGGGNVEDPVCPQCAYQISNWVELANLWWEDRQKYSWKCPVCTGSFPMWGLDWVRTNGFGRISIALWHVHRGEARPTVRLFSELEAISGTPWNYFYYRL